MPSVDGNANGNYLGGHSQQGSGHELDWFAMLSASYEVDFWGKNHATANAARLQAGASRADRDTVALTMLGAVANEYFQVLALRERITIARANSDATHKVLEVVQARFDSGVASPVELAEQKAAVDAAQIALHGADGTDQTDGARKAEADAYQHLNDGINAWLSDTPGMTSNRPSSLLNLYQG